MARLLVKRRRRNADQKIMKRSRTQRSAVLLVGVGLAVSLLASCAVKRENTTPPTLPPDFSRELVREAEEAQQQVFRDAEELSELFAEDEGLSVIGIP